MSQAAHQSLKEFLALWRESRQFAAYLEAKVGREDARAVIEEVREARDRSVADDGCIVRRFKGLGEPFEARQPNGDAVPMAHHQNKLHNSAIAKQERRANNRLPAHYASSIGLGWARTQDRSRQYRGWSRLCEAAEQCGAQYCRPYASATALSSRSFRNELFRAARYPGSCAHRSPARRGWTAGAVLQAKKA